MPTARLCKGRESDAPRPNFLLVFSQLRWSVRDMCMIEILEFTNEPVPVSEQFSQCPP